MSTEKSLNEKPLNEPSPESPKSDLAQVSATEIKDRPPRKLLFLTLLASLLYIAIGALLYPRWWYGMFFESGWQKPAFWLTGTEYLISLYGSDVILHALTVIAVIMLIRTRVPDRISSFTSSIWTASISKLKAGIIVAGTILFLVASVFLADTRSRNERAQEKEHEETMKRLDEDLKEAKRSLEKLREESKPPLAEPTKFVFLDKNSVDSLYGQYEPDLVPTVVTVEMKDTKDFKGEVNIESFLKTEVGRQLLNSRIAEYRSTTKNSERKLKDLITYFAEKNKQNIFRDVKPQSEELRKFDEATQLYTRTYDLGIDTQKLRQVRDRLLSEQVRSTEVRLQSIHGLVFIEGNWTVDIRSDSYIFRRPFVEHVSDSPTCEVKLRKDSFAIQDRDIIDQLPQKQMRLSVFGNVLTGVSNNSRVVYLSPIAVF